MASDHSYLSPKTMSFDLAKNRVLVECEDTERVRGWLGKAEKGDFVVRLEERLQEGENVEVLVRGGGLELPLRCLVKQVFRSGLNRHGTMLEWLDKDGGEDPNKVESEPQEFTSGFSQDTASEAPSAEAQEPPSGPDSQWTEIPVQRSEIAEPTELVLEQGASSTEAASGTLSLTRRLPDPAPEGTEMFDSSALNPEDTSDDDSKASAVDLDSENAEISVDRAERGAEELEALLNQSGTWRRKAVQAATNEQGARLGSNQEDSDNEDSDNEDSDREISTPDSDGEAGSDPAGGESKNSGLTSEAQQAITHNEMRGVSLTHIIGSMNPNEKARLAVRASRQERRLLLRDHTFSVQMGLLNNPRTENKEILEIAANPQTTGGILKRLASDRKWASNYDIQKALVKHPGTPSPLAIRLLSQLRISDLRVFAKSQALRENIRKAALRLYLQKSE